MVHWPVSRNNNVVPLQQLLLISFRGRKADLTAHTSHDFDLLSGAYTVSSGAHTVLLSGAYTVSSGVQ